MDFTGLAEAGLIASKLSRRDMLSSLDEDESPFYFSPERCLLSSHVTDLGPSFSRSFFGLEC